MRILLILLGAFFALNLSANVIKNGDFSLGLKYWKSLGAQLSDTVTAGDKKAVCVTAKKTVIQSVPLEPNAVYELSFLVKGENISKANPGKWGGRIILNAGKVYGRVTGTADGSCLVGTFDWKRVVTRIEAAKYKRSRLNIHLYLDADGKLYFADFKMKKVGMTKLEVTKPGNQFFRESYVKGYPLPDFYPTDKAHGLLEPGKNAEFNLEMQKLDDLEYTLTVKNELGKVVYTQKRKPYTEGEKIIVPGQERGYYILEVEAFVKDKKVAMVQSAFISTPKMAKRDPFFRVNQFGIWTPLLEGYRMMGLGSATLPIIGKEKGDPAANARKRFLGTYKRFLDSDFELHALYVGGMNQNNCDMDKFRRGYSMFTHEYMKDVEDSVTEAAKILKGKVKTYGSIMEIPSAAQMKHKHVGTWVEAMSNQLITSRIVSRAARKIDPTAKITAGGNNIEMYIEPYERIVMSDLIDDFDIYNIDAYFGNWNLTVGKPNVPERSLRSFYIKSSKLASSLGKSPMVENTETGYNIFYGNRFDEGLAVTQAFLTARAMIISKSAPVSSVALYRLSTHYGFNENNPMSGCFATCWKPGRAADNRTMTYTPLPGGAAYAAFARELAFVKFVKEIKSFDNQLYCYVFTRPDGKTMLSAWILDGSFDLNLNLTKPALLVSMYGRETPLAAGRQLLKLTQQPFYLVSAEPAEKLAAQVENIFKSIRPQYKAGAKLTAPDSAMLFVNNTLNEKIHVKCGAKTMDILPGLIGNMSVKIKKGQKNIDLTIGGEKITAKVIDNTVKFFRNKDNAKRKLVVPDNVKPVSALHPELSYFKSSMNPNGHNVSAEYSLTYDKSNIYLTVKVDDPVHVQRFSKDNIWRGDSLQFVFAAAPAAPADVRTMDTPSKSYTEGHNYSVALTPRGTEIVKYHTNFGTKVKANAVRQGNNTIYTITVPKSEIGYTDGKPLYFNFVVFDNNSKIATVAPYWLDMDDGLAGNRDNAALPLVIFE